MPTFEPRDPDFELRVRASFARQPMMTTLGAELVTIEPGSVQIMLPFRDDLTQQNGFLHAAAVTAIADSACGYAAMTLTAPGHDVLSVEFKVNLLAPAVGARFVATGRVLRPGRTLTVSTAEVRGDDDKLIAAMQATIIARRIPD
ncbi:MAG: hotdog fold thioesterase [Rhodothermaceae bacterium]|nr:hotdog fold thioesterase [Rhodothermaceae bacterium]